MHAMFLRDREEAVRKVAAFNAARGETSKWGRIVTTLLGAEMEERELGGRPLYLVRPIEHVHDPLFDGNLSREVLAARHAYEARA